MHSARPYPNPWWVLFAIAAVSLLACQLVRPIQPTPAPRPPTPTPHGRATAGPAVDTPQARRPFTVNSAALSFAAPAHPGGKVQFDENSLPFLQLFPDLHDAPAPDWLQTGIRVTYRVQSATIPQAEDQKGAAGAGYAQYDVVAVDQGLVVANSKLYLDTSDGAGLLPSLMFPVLGLPGIGEFWLNPQALVQAEQVATDALAVARMDKTIDGQVYHGVYFEYKHETTRYVWMYDEATGVLLFSSYAIGGEDDPTRQLGQITFVAQRQLDLPWRDGSAPDWLARLRHLHYDGTFQTEMTGASVPAIAAHADVDLQDHFDRWSAYSLSAGVQGTIPVAVLRLTGGDQIFDGLWLAPEALAVLKDGQTLDSDPITGAKITVARDHHTVTLTETGQRYQSSLTYNAFDGRLLESSLREQIGIATNLTQLTLSTAD